MHHTGLLAACLFALALAGCGAPAAAPGAATAIAPDRSPLADTSWKLEAFGDAAGPRPVLANSTITLAFSAEQRTASGRSGCNSYGGRYAVAGDRVSFDEIASTAMACADGSVMDQEQRFQQALLETSTYRVAGDRLEISYGDGKVLRFVAATAT